MDLIEDRPDVTIVGLGCLVLGEGGPAPALLAGSKDHRQVDHAGRPTRREKASTRRVTRSAALSCLPPVIEGSDADSFAYSLSNFAEIIFPCLEATEAESVIEVGAFRGATTRDLLDWGATRGVRVTAVEPVPPAELLALASEHPELELIRETSLEALQRIQLADAIILDGDHNYYTASRELKLIEERAPGAGMPLLILHDVGWPLARRDAYEAPEQIPEEHRQPMAHDVGVAPGEPGVVPGGLFYSNVAAREGGPRNGVMTAIEDFIGERPGLRLAVVHAFFGLGVI